MKIDLRLRALVLVPLMAVGAAARSDRGHGPTTAEISRLIHGQPLTYWLEELKSSDPLVHEEAIEVLGQAGPDAAAALPTLTDMLNSGDANVRFRAALALWKIDHRATAIPVLAEAVGTAPVDVRLRAAETLGRCGPAASAAAPALVTELAELNPLLRESAESALEALGPAGVTALAKGASAANATVREESLIILSDLGPEAQAAVSAVAASLQHRDVHVRLAAARALWQIDGQADTAVRVAVDILRTGSPPDRGAALSLLAAVRPRPKAAVAALTDLVKEDDVALRFKAAQALWDSTHDAASIVPIVVDAVQEPRLSSSMDDALRLVSRLGPQARDAVPALMEQFKANGRYPTPTLMAALASTGPAAVEALVQTIVDKDRRLFLPAATTLALIGKDALPALMKLADNPDFQIHGAAFQALGQMGPAARDAVPKLVERLKSGNQSTFAQTIMTIGQIGPAARKAVPVLLDILKDDPRPYDQQLALMALSEIGPEARDALPRLLELVKTPNSNLRGHAVAALAKMQPDAKAAAELKGLLKDDQPQIRQTAAELLLRLNPNDEAAAATLVELLHSRTPGNRELALQSAARLNGSGGQLVPALAELLKDKDAAIRTRALDILTQMGTAALAAVPQLCAVAADAGSNLRLGAAMALARMGAGQAVAVPALVDALVPNDDLGRERVLEALGKFGPTAKAAVPALERALDDSNSSFATAAAAALYKIDRAAAKAALRELRSYLHGRDRSAAVAAALLIAQLDTADQAGCDRLRRALTDADETVRRAAAAGLAELGPRARTAARALRTALDDDDAGVAVQAAIALWKIDGNAAEAVPVLKKAVQSGRRHGRERLQAVEGLGDIGPAARPAIEALRDVVDESDPDLRAAAAAALARIDPEAAKAAGR